MRLLQPGLEPLICSETGLRGAGLLKGVRVLELVIQIRRQPALELVLVRQINSVTELGLEIQRGYWLEQAR